MTNKDVILIKKQKQKYKELPGKYADSDDDVMWEYWELQEQRQKNKKLGLSAFLRKHNYKENKTQKDTEE